MPQGYATAQGGLSRGLSRGLGLASQFQQMGLRREQADREKEQFEMQKTKAIQQQKQDAIKEKRLVESQRWEKMTGFAKMHLDFVSKITNKDKAKERSERKKYLQKAFGPESKVFGQSEEFQTFGNAIPEMSDDDQSTLKTMISTANKHIKDGNFDELSTTAFQMDALNKSNNWGMDKTVDYMFKILGMEKKEDIAPAGGGQIKVTPVTNEIALDEFDKPYIELTSEQRGVVLDLKQQKKINVSAAATLANIEVNKQKPLSAMDLTRFVHPDTLAKFPAGTTMEDITEAGAFAATPKQLEEISALDNVRVIVDTMDKTSQRLMTAGGPIEAAKQYASLKTGAFTKSNTLAATYQDQQAQFTGVLARALGGEKGVLTDIDIERVVKGQPLFRDTKGIRDLKMGTIKILLDTATDAKRRTITGKPPDPEIRKRIDKLLDVLDSYGGADEETRKSPATANEFLNKYKVNQ
jgi:hypothetical protein